MSKQGWINLCLITAAVGALACILGNQVAHDNAIGRPVPLNNPTDFGVSFSNYEVVMIDCDSETFVGFANGEKVAKLYDYSKLRGKDICHFKDLSGHDVKKGDRVEIRNGYLKFIRVNDELLNPKG